MVWIFICLFKTRADRRGCPSLPYNKAGKLVELVHNWFSIYFLFFYKPSKWPGLHCEPQTACACAPRNHFGSTGCGKNWEYWTDFPVDPTWPLFWIKFVDTVVHCPGSFRAGPVRIPVILKIQLVYMLGIHGPGKLALSYRWTGWAWENNRLKVKTVGEKFTDHLRGIYRVNPPDLVKANWRMSTCNRLDFANTRISTE